MLKCEGNDLAPTLHELGSIKAKASNHQPQRASTKPLNVHMKYFLGY